MSLQQALNQPSNGAVYLSQGVYEESVVIQRPCVIEGNGAVIVSNRSPVIQINAPNVTLRNVRVYLTGGQGVCIRTNSLNAALEGVELNGALAGFPEENPQWILPSFVDVGLFAAGSVTNRVAFPLNSPAQLKLSHALHGVELFANTLSPGLNKAVLTIRNIEDSRTLYGVISAVRSGVVRKIRIYGQARANVAPLKLPPDYLRGQTAPFIAARGGRWDALSNILHIRLSPRVPKEFDVQTFAFLLNRHGLTQKDEDLIFFNCPTANGVRLEADNRISLNLDSISSSVQQVTIAFSIYNDRKEFLFHQLRGYSLLIHGSRPDEFNCALPLDNLEPVKTLIALDIYRGANPREWKLYFRGEAYSDGLEKLCQRYGLDVESS